MSYDLMREKVTAELKQAFRPEFLNRIDATVVFRPLTIEEIREIVDLMLARVHDRLRAQDMTLEVTQGAKDHIISLGYDVAYGAAARRRSEHDRGPARGASCSSAGTSPNTIVVERDPEAGLSIHAAAGRRRSAL
jgi:hypothetical protein